MWWPRRQASMTRTRSRRMCPASSSSSAAVALVFGGAFAVAYPLIDWGSSFKVSPGAADEAGRPLPSTLHSSWPRSPHRSPNACTWVFRRDSSQASGRVVGSILALGGVLLAIALDAGLVWLVAAVAAGPFGRFDRQLDGSVRDLAAVDPPSNAERNEIGDRQDLRNRSAFLALTVAGALGYQSDSFVVARILGAERVTEYAVPMRLFFIAPTLLSFLLAPLWPAYREAFRKGNSTGSSAPSGAPSSSGWASTFPLPAR